MRTESRRVVRSIDCSTGAGSPSALDSGPNALATTRLSHTEGLTSWRAEDSLTRRLVSVETLVLRA